MLLDDLDHDCRLVLAKHSLHSAQRVEFAAFHIQLYRSDSRRLRACSKPVVQHDHLDRYRHPGTRTWRRVRVAGVRPIDHKMQPPGSIRNGKQHHSEGIWIARDPCGLQKQMKDRRIGFKSDRAAPIPMLVSHQEGEVSHIHTEIEECPAAAECIEEQTLGVALVPSPKLDPVRHCVARAAQNSGSSPCPL